MGSINPHPFWCHLKQSEGSHEDVSYNVMSPIDVCCSINPSIHHSCISTTKPSLLVSQLSYLVGSNLPFFG